MRVVACLIDGSSLFGVEPGVGAQAAHGGGFTKARITREGQEDPNALVRALQG
jgi:hypothetical protein